MATPGKGRGLAQGTRAPAGSTASVQFQRKQYDTSPLWPGWTNSDGGRCTCSWSYRDNLLQVKCANGGCPVHRGRQ